MNYSIEPTRNRFGRRMASLVAAFLIPAASLPAVGLASNPADYADDLRFREEFGLTTELAAIAAIKPTASSEEAFGLPLTAEELRDLEDRVAAEPAIAQLQAHLRTIPSFAGLYIDQEAGGVVDIAFAEDPSLHNDAIASHPIGLPSRTRQVAISETDLLRLNERVAHDREALDSLGIQANEVYPDIRANVVMIGVEPFTPGVVQTLHQRYGDAIEVYQASPAGLTACTNRNNCPGGPLRGGLHLSDPGCTTAFLGLYNGYDVILSAGHCADLVPSGHTYQHPDNTAIGNIGTMLKETYHTGSNADAMVIRIQSSLASNRVYNTPTSWFGMATTQTTGQEVIGQAVCQSSRVSGYTCGTLYAKGFSITYSGGTTLYDQRSATYTVNSGDSGGPIFYATQARGVQSGKNEAGRAIYSHITNVTSAIGMTVNTQDPCPQCN